eukprot:6186953-Pleurochrysis_carterae.AAC.2
MRCAAVSADDTDTRRPRHIQSKGRRSDYAAGTPSKWLTSDFILGERSSLLRLEAAVYWQVSRVLRHVAECRCFMWPC